MPNTLIDAVNYNVPCIATNVSGATDILVDGKGGIIVPNNHQKELEKSINYAIKFNSKMKTKSKVAKKQIYRFTNSNCVLIHNQLKKLNYKL